MGRNFIWLFGENLAATSNNNSYYFWKQVVRRRDGIDKYIVLEPSRGGDVDERDRSQRRRADHLLIEQT